MVGQGWMAGGEVIVVQAVVEVAKGRVRWVWRGEERRKTMN